MTSPETLLPQAATDAAMKLAMDTLKQVPKRDPQVLEAHLTAVLIVFWGALWGTLGTEYARGFIEAQLRSMELNCSSCSGSTVSIWWSVLV